MSVILEDTVKGSFHQGDISHFNPDTAGRQCMANAIAAAVYATMLPMRLWDSSTLDRILLAGDALYSRRCNSQHDYLQFSDIQPTERIFYDDYIINGSSPMTGLLHSENVPSGPYFTLEEAIFSMENVHQFTYGVLTIADGNSGASVLLCVQDKNYYIFDSHSRDNFGNVIANGTSVLLHIKRCNGFIKYIRSISNQLCATQFEITVLAAVSSGYHRMMQQTHCSQRKTLN